MKTTEIYKDSEQVYLAGRIFGRVEIIVRELPSGIYTNCQINPRNLLRHLRFHLRDKRVKKSTRLTGLIEQFKPEMIRPGYNGSFDFGYYHEKGEHRAHKAKKSQPIPDIPNNPEPRKPELIWSRSNKGGRELLTNKQSGEEVAISLNQTDQKKLDERFGIKTGRKSRNPYGGDIYERECGLWQNTDSMGIRGLWNMDGNPHDKSASRADRITIKVNDYDKYILDKGAISAGTTATAYRRKLLGLPEIKAGAKKGNQNARKKITINEK